MTSEQSKEARIEALHARLYRGLIGGDSTLDVSHKLQTAIAKIPDGSITAIQGGSVLTPAIRGKQRPPSWELLLMMPNLQRRILPRTMQAQLLLC